MVARSTPTRYTQRSSGTAIDGLGPGGAKSYRRGLSNSCSDMDRQSCHRDPMDRWATSGPRTTGSQRTTHGHHRPAICTAHRHTPPPAAGRRHLPRLSDTEEDTGSGSIGRPGPARPIGPWWRRIGAPEASAARRTGTPDAHEIAHGTCRNSPGGAGTG
jgi:hypothetical protein